MSFVVCGSRERSSLVGLRALERHFRIITSGTLGAFVECYQPTWWYEVLLLDGQTSCNVTMAQSEDNIIQAYDHYSHNNLRYV